RGLCGTGVGAGRTRSLRWQRALPGWSWLTCRSAVWQLYSYMSLEWGFVAIIARTGAMHFEKCAVRVQCNHWMMTDTAMVIDALVAAGQKGADVLWPGRFAGWRHHDDVALAVKRHEDLAAQRMTFQQP